jgi:hypothetical protein
MTAILPPTDHQPVNANEQPSRPTPHRHRWQVVLGVLAALVLVAATVVVAYYATRGPSSPITPPTAAAPPTTQPSINQPSTTQPTTQPSTTPSSLTPQESAQITAAARSFVTEVVGMVDPVGGSVRLRADGTAAVDFRAIAPNGLPVGGAATTVVFARNGASWGMVGTFCDAIRVDAPTTGQMISTPVTVSGQADVYEGTVLVRILEPAGGKLIEEGRGVVTGGSFGVPAPFQGQIAFRQPNGGPGWVVFSEESAATGQIVRATVVTVSFPIRS